jgi:predicted dehydrogenase
MVEQLSAVTVAEMKRYNVAVIGYGWASIAHIAAINATGRAQVIAVFSSRKHDAAFLSQRHGCLIEVYHDLGAMLRREDIDVVSICSYPNLHAEHLTAVALAGKHFIIEKPIALSAADACEASSVVAATGVKGCVCFEGRFSRQFLATKSLIDSGLLGTIHYGEFDYYHGIGPWYSQFRWNTRKASGGSSLLTAGCHALSSMLLCMGNDVETVTSLATCSHNEVFSEYEYPTTSVTIVRFKDGRIGKVASVIDCLQPYYRHTHLIGSEGSLLDNRFYSRRIAGLDQNNWSELSFPVLESGDVHSHPYKPQFEAFFAALDRGEDMPLTSFNEGLITHRVAFAADLSAAESRTVRLDEMPVLSTARAPASEPLVVPALPRKAAVLATVNGTSIQQSSDVSR